MSGKGKKEKKDIIKHNLIEHQSEAKVVRKIVLIVTIVLILASITVIGGGYFYINSALKPIDPDNHTEKQIDIPIGSSVTEIANLLEDHGIIKNARVFKYYVKFKNESGFMAGNYDLAPAMTYPEIIDRLKTGSLTEEVVFKMTIPEGKQLEQIAEIMAEKTNQNKDEIINKMNDQDFIQSLIAKYPDVLTDEILQENIRYPLEGYLFPATYSFYKEDPTIEEMVTTMLDKTNEVLKDYRGAMEEKGYTPHKLLTMASLIEEEATANVDRQQIASVFYNRLEVGMPLQTDPTVLYAQGAHKDRVLYEDLEIDSPYNTYKNTGLTPGPIANAGTTSIDATLAPAETDYLYFLATSTGEVLFSKSLDEHNQYKAEHISK